MARWAEEWRAAGIATLVQVLLTTVALSTVALSEELLSRRQPEAEVFNDQSRTVFTSAGIMVMTGALVLPWLAAT